MNTRYKTLSEAQRNAELLARIPPAGDDPAFVKAADLALTGLGMTGRPDLREPNPVKRRILERNRELAASEEQTLFPERR